MKRKEPYPPADADQEISALIETLHRTGQRLEEITAGEVDAVADREGRTFLLRHAQELLRHSEAAKQAAILNVLPAHIALLDSQGVIISVNEAWRRFGSENGLRSPDAGIGLNYLEICARARGDDASEAPKVETGNTGDANLVARIGADHFATVLPEVKQGGDGARLLEERIKAFMDHPFRLNDAVFRIAVKVGVAVFPEDGADADILFRHAEAALKKAKASGERYLFYTQTMTEAAAGRLTLENQLRNALDNEEFVLHYQPKVDLVSGKITSAEALIRWNDPRTGLVPPGRFIPILEETGMIYEVGHWAVRKAISDYLRWRAAGLPANAFDAFGNHVVVTPHADVLLGFVIGDDTFDHYLAAWHIEATAPVDGIDREERAFLLRFGHRRKIAGQRQQNAHLYFDRCDSERRPGSKYIAKQENRQRGKKLVHVYSFIHGNVKATAH
jgi:GGDEF domain-containing protein